MVKAINFAVRTSAGKVVHGGVSGDGGSQFLQVGSGESVSLNIPQSSVVAYQHQGKDLVLKLSDGREITLNGYFESNPGEDNKLYLSNDGEVTEVFLTDGGDGAVYANYGPVDTWNKYSNVDDLRFTDDNTLMAGEYADDQVGMAPFVPGLLAGMGGGGLGAAAAVAGGLGVIGAVGGGGGSGGHTRVPPAVDHPEVSKDISTVTPDKTVVVSGTGEPGEKVDVVIGGKTQTTEIGKDGTWETEFKGDKFPGDGTHEAVVTVTDGDGKTEVLDGPEFVIDMTPPLVSTTEGTVSVGDVENLVEYKDGVTLKGEGEVGAKIDVVVDGHSHQTVVAADGTWTVTFTQTEIAGGEYQIPVTITATDAAGNQTVITDRIAIDTIPHPLNFNSVTADNVINGAEASGEVAVTGTSTAGAVVTVVMEGHSQSVTTDASGSWTVKYPAGTFTTGDFDRSFTATTVDAAGNTSSATHTVKVDTTTSVSFTAGSLTADNIINESEAQTGVTLTGQAEVGSTSVSVVWNGTTLPATIAADGTWSVNFPTSAVPTADGVSTATVTSTDAYGNTASNTRDISVDRGTAVTIDANQAGGDDTIMSTEANAGVTLTGTAEKGATVAVEFQGTTHTVTANASGTWSAKFNSGEITPGTYANGADNTVSVTATDKAGNIAKTTHMIAVDTEVTDFARSTLSTGEDNVLNNVEANDGLTVTGTVEAGSSVQVNFGSVGPFNATVSGTTWTVTIPKANIPQGETEVKLTAVATDHLGNVSAPHSEMIEIDRVVTPFDRDGGTLGGDGILNAQEVANGLDLQGSGEVGSTVVVKLSNGAEQTIEVGADGTWSTRFEADQLPHGQGGPDMRVTVSATDLAGNTASFDEFVKIDTVAEDAPGVTSIVKATSGANLTGVIMDETIDSNFSFHKVDQTGHVTDISLKNGSNGSTFAQFDKPTVPDGDYLVINHADDAGNDSATLLVTNNTGTATVDLHNTAFHNFDFSSIDLTLAATNMTISADDLIAMTGPDKMLMIKGGADDHVTLTDATAAGTQVVDGESYHLYHLGDNGASVLLDDDINTVI
ncbi:Ig-like domain-containing protein [Pseudorhodobacter sp.]|uniref:BapA/Bap/LapF family prefix-like domain-containing protein n=1 Tax=Pseudorhodobacter sp. TaxID=1934400 RepID=UPI00264783ED|nr:Ig-like domain-containing protein [Pseudorhodobacter sp.]MDN5786762.1 Ig-like domain-containing protein [Pseudorhodobacter sp.]